jgi:hypothetical protein
MFGLVTVPVYGETYETEPGDAPDHGVARVSVISGDVTVRRGDSGEFVAADLNTPLVERDHVLTEKNGRTEIQFDWSTLLRLAPDSEVRLSELRDRDFLVQLAQGTVTLRVRRDSDSHIEVSMPSASFVPTEDGVYRITVRDDFSTEITVRSGKGEVYVGRDRDTLREGQTLLVRGDPSDPQRAYRNALPRDEWDLWNEDRDRELDRSDSYKYVSRDIYGAEDLSRHGHWVYDPPYGWVWVPSVAAGWAPYRVGRWSWVDYYGWTWISGDPWGWAPYHYGRWYHAPRYGWVWYPGVVTVRYTWRPALVAFFGWGSIHVGWVPLAPYEVYRPWYGYGRTVVNNVTVVNNINVVNTYRNARFVSGHSGVTSVVSHDFGRRNITVNNYVAGKDRDYSRAGDAERWLSREPTRENRQFTDRQAPSRVASRREVERPFVTRPDRPSRVVSNDNIRNERNDRDDANRSRVDVRPEPRGNARNDDRDARDTAARSRVESRVEPRTESRESRPAPSVPAENSRRPEARVENRDSRPNSPSADAGNARRAEPRVESRESRPAPSAPAENSRRAEPPRAEPRESRPSSVPSNQDTRRADVSRGNGRTERNEAVAVQRSQPESPRRAEIPEIPRSEPPRSRAPESSRPSIAAAPSSRPEPPRGVAGRERAEEARPQGPRVSSGEGRSAGPQSPQSSQSSPAPVVRGESPGRSSGNPQPAPAPSAQASENSGGNGGNGNGNGNGRRGR